MTAAQVAAAGPTGTAEIVVALLAAPFGFLCLIPQMIAFSMAWNRFKNSRLHPTPNSATARTRSVVAMIISFVVAWAWIAYI